MSSPVERAALVGLLRQGRRPWQVYAELVETTGSALGVLEDELERDAAPQTLFDAAVRGPDLSPRIDLTTVLDDAAAEVATWRSEGIQVLTVLDPGYPENLRGVHDRPPLLFVAGELTPPDARAVAVVGSRTPTARGLALADRVARGFVEAGYTVVSGLAAGIDTAAHEAALDSGGRTLAVLGTGLRRCYPPENGRLARRIAGECAVLSQFWPDAPPTRRTFPMRNGVMTGLTLGSVIVEASQTSGTRVLARLALAQGRPVFLHSSLLSQPWARELATRPGTHAVTSADEVAAVLDRLTADEELFADTSAVGSPGG
jgi:DNA processing protein